LGGLRERNWKRKENPEKREGNWGKENKETLNTHKEEGEG